ncbi:MAG: hypothetical protein ABJE66_29405 [Deltaproteobacteria bacterium]
MAGPFTGVKVFSATMLADRAKLGEKVTSWIEANPHLRVVDLVQTQSSDDAFHCIAISVFFDEKSENGKVRARQLAR